MSRLPEMVKWPRIKNHSCLVCAHTHLPVLSDLSVRATLKSVITILCWGISCSRFSPLQKVTERGQRSLSHASSRQTNNNSKSPNTPLQTRHISYLSPLTSANAFIHLHRVTAITCKELLYDGRAGHPVDKSQVFRISPCFTQNNHLSLWNLQHKFWNPKKGSSGLVHSEGPQGTTCMMVGIGYNDLLSWASVFSIPPCCYTDRIYYARKCHSATLTFISASTSVCIGKLKKAVMLKVQTLTHCTCNPVGHRDNYFLRWASSNNNKISLTKGIIESELITDSINKTLDQ